MHNFLLAPKPGWLVFSVVAVYEGVDGRCVLLEGGDLRQLHAHHLFRQVLLVPVTVHVSEVVICVYS